MARPESEPLSPELILVATPEQAREARAQLADPPRNVSRLRTAPDRSDADWNEFLADVRSRTVGPVVAERPPTRAPVRREGRKRLLVAAAVIAVIGAIAVVVGLGWGRDRSQQRPASSAPAMPAPPHREAAPPQQTKPAKPKPPPAARARTPKSSPPTKARKPVRPQRHAGGFVPTRVWSWAAAAGANAYVVRFLRNGHNVLKVRTAGPRLVLPSRFTFAPGRYRWTVTTVPRRGKGGRVVVNSSFVVSASNG